ncbi:hypothetical protein SLA2020_284100 [Shorea laevis]
MQLLNVVAQLVIAMTNARILEPRVEEKGCSFGEFNKHPFSTFDGSGGHLKAENWLNDIEEILKVTGNTKDSFKVMYTADKLSRQDKHWWEAKEELVGFRAERTIISTRFKEKFNN